jgi:hypothetical protein
MSFDKPRAALASFVQDLKITLSAPTQANHTPRPDLSFWRNALAELTRPTSSVHTVYVQTVQSNAGGGLIYPVQRLADGGAAIAAGFRRLAGRITGPGTETSDSIPALLSAGEFVVRAASVRKFGQAFFEAVNAGLLPAMPALPRFAAGGAVGSILAQAPLGSGASSTPARDVVDLRFHVGGKAHTVQSSRDTAMALASALRELSRAS